MYEVLIFEENVELVFPVYGYIVLHGWFGDGFRAFLRKNGQPVWLDLVEIVQKGRKLEYFFEVLFGVPQSYCVLFSIDLYEANVVHFTFFCKQNLEIFKHVRLCSQLVNEFGEFDVICILIGVESLLEPLFELRIVNFFQLLDHQSLYF